MHFLWKFLLTKGFFLDLVIIFVSKNLVLPTGITSKLCTFKNSTWSKIILDLLDLHFQHVQLNNKLDTNQNFLSRDGLKGGQRRPQPPGHSNIFVGSYIFFHFRYWVPLLQNLRTPFSSNQPSHPSLTSNCPTHKLNKNKA